MLETKGNILEISNKSTFPSSNLQDVHNLMITTNLSSIFPLQTLGIDVDVINTVQYSNHTGYPKGFGGEILQPETFDKIITGLRNNRLLYPINAVLQGYTPNVPLLQRVCDLVKDMKQNNPNFIYVSDTVMGDNGHLYVSEQVVECYRDTVLPIANFITPNQFEAELLSNTKITTQEDAIKAVDILHSKGVSCVVITSLFYEGGDTITLLGSKVISNENENLQTSKFIINFPSLKHYFTGTGDLFAALLIGWFLKSDGNLKESCEKAVATIQAILQKTKDYYQLSNPHLEDNCGVNQSVTELRIIQSKNEIEEPNVIHKAVEI